jgi:hypothetical protein
MKLPSKILSSILFASLNATLLAGVPDEPQQEKPPVVEKASPEVRAKAEAAIKAGIADVLREASERRSRFSRSLPLSFDFTVVFVETGPLAMTTTAERLPFEVRRSLQKRADLPVKQPDYPVTTAVAGYYDVKTAAIQLYDVTAKAYVPAAEHPLIKRWAPVGPPVPAPAR